MQPADLKSVAAVERAAYQYPWSLGIFRDCLLAGYLLLRARRRRQRDGLRHHVGRRRRGASLESVRAPERAALGLRQAPVECADAERRPTRAPTRCFSRCGRRTRSRCASTRRRVRADRHSPGLLSSRERPRRRRDPRRDSAAPRADLLNASPHARAPEKANVRDHFAPRRGQDHADREAAAVRRRDPDGGRRQGPQGDPARDVGLDAPRAGARHLDHVVRDAVSVRRRADQPARHAGSRGFLRGHVSHADGRRQRADGHRRREGRRGADDQAHGSLPAAHDADHQLHQQARSRRPAADRAARRHRDRARHRLRAADVADRHGTRVSRHLRSARGLRAPLSEPRRQPAARRQAGARACERRARRARSAQTRPRALREEVELVRGATPEFDHAAYLAGRQTPVFFGAAIHNYGVRELLDAFATLAPPPQPRATSARTVAPDESPFSGFVFKIQANMDPAHRDRIAFLRVCSGAYRPGMRMYHTRLAARGPRRRRDHVHGGRPPARRARRTRATSSACTITARSTSATASRRASRSCSRAFRASRRSCSGAPCCAIR